MSLASTSSGQQTSNDERDLPEHDYTIVSALNVPSLKGELDEQQHRQCTVSVSSKEMPHRTRTKREKKFSSTAVIEPIETSKVKVSCADNMTTVCITLSDAQPTTSRSTLASPSGNSNGNPTPVFESNRMLSGCVRNSSKPKNKRKVKQVEFAELCETSDHNNAHNNRRTRDTADVNYDSSSTTGAIIGGARSRTSSSASTCTAGGGSATDQEDSVVSRGSDFRRFFMRPRSRSRSPSRAQLARCQRLQQPRLSLLGKPINYKPLKQRDPRYRRTQIRLNNFLERPRGFIAIFYHILE